MGDLCLDSRQDTFITSAYLGIPIIADHSVESGRDFTNSFDGSCRVYVKTSPARLMGLLIIVSLRRLAG